MKTRLLSRLCLLGAFAVSAFAAEPAATPVHATTITKSAIKIGNGSFALVKGTKLEVLGREGDNLIVKFRSTQGKIPLAETDYPTDTPLPATVPAAPTPAVQTKPLPAVAKPVAPVATTPAAKAATPPALSVDGKPATNYGKAVQKAKQVSEANKSTHVDPTKDIMDEQPK
jgi:hypothetical protein